MEDNLTPEPAPSPATEPFNDHTSADIILRSSDNIDFYLHKIILSIASPFFKDMFSLVQPPSMSPDQGDAPSSTQSQQIIPVTEDGATVDQMLRLVYPIVEPASGTFEEVVKVLEASLKYQIEKVVVHMKASLRTLADDHPLRVYAVACRLKLEDEAKVAATAWKGRYPSLRSSRICPCGCGCTIGNCHCGRSDYRSYRDNNGSFLTCGCHEYHGVSVSELLNPSDFSATIAGASFVEEMEGITAGSYFRLLQHVRGGSPPSFCEPAISATEDLTEIDENIRLYFLRHTQADIIIQCGDGLQFHAHRLILSMASAYQIIGDRNEEGTSEDSLPVVHLGDSGSTTGCLLRLCYPFPEELDLTDIPQLTKVRAVAEKYNIPSAISLARKLMMEQVDEDPLQIYFLAKQYGWQADAEEAAMECVRLDSVLDDMYTPAMENSPARVYYDLLKARSDGLPKDAPATGGMPAGGKKKKKKGKKL